jgi:hypothetical protein
VIAEGSLVTYVGDGIGRDAGLYLEDQGKVVSSTPTHSHVSWRSGALKGSIVLVSNNDLVVARTASTMDDSLDGPLVATAVQQTYEEGGARRLLSALIQEGHTAGFAAIADEVISLVASRIRQDPSFRAVLAQLDNDAGDDLISLASVSLLRDAFREVA